MGFPIGGDYLSITEGVLSRIEVLMSQSSERWHARWWTTPIAEGPVGISSLGLPPFHTINIH